MCFLKVVGNSNKRLGAMNKLTNVVHSGWMTKSPPEQKLPSPLKIFRAKWKQRFFVLHKPSGSLPDQYELSYYSSEQCSKKKGSIDLEQCEQIIESLDSDQYPYLLAIKTICRSKVRTYYLATNSEEDMGTWVQCLCRVCGLKQEDTPTDIPDSRLGLHGMSGSPSVATSSVASSNIVRSSATATPVVTSQPVQATFSRASNVTASTSSTNSHPPPSTSPQSYVFLNECTTGTSHKRNDYGRTDSIDSVPEYQAPPPPAKRGHQLPVVDSESAKNNHQDSAFDVYDRPPAAGRQDTYDRPKSGGQEMYDHPRSAELHGSQASLDDDAFYKVPPEASGQASLMTVKKSADSPDAVDLNAAVPVPMPRRSPRSVHSSLSDRPCTTASGHLMTESYDVPPPRHTSTSNQDGRMSSSSIPTPPQRPPKPHTLITQSPYQNLPSNSKVHEHNSLSAVISAPAKQSAAAFSYDVPRASTTVFPPRESSVLDIAPPAPASRGGAPASSHAYLNTVPGLSNCPSVPPLPDTYFPAKNGEKEEEDLVYADMDGPPPPSHCKPAPMMDLSYADMSSGDAGGQVPPVAPRPPARTGTVPVQRSLGSVNTNGAGGDMEHQNIWSNLRTKSFKRNNQVDVSPSLPARPPRRPPLPARTEFASSSEDDDDLSIDGNNTHHDLSVVRMSTVPAAPDFDTEPELKYLDLALDTPPEPSRPQAAASHGTPTEYREIDFVKTRALQDTKKARNMEK